MSTWTHERYSNGMGEEDRGFTVRDTRASTGMEQKASPDVPEPEVVVEAPQVRPLTHTWGQYEQLLQQKQNAQRLDEQRRNERRLDEQRRANPPPPPPGAPGERHSRKIPQDVIIAVSVRDHGKCVSCGATTDLHFDHKIPWSRGGTNNENNIQLMCGSCNRRKGAVDISDEDW
jgi:5-methylcytosine-specific restriction endonuclease McrA